MDRLEQQETLAQQIINFQIDMIPRLESLSLGATQALIESLHDLWQRFSSGHHKLCRKSKNRTTPYFQSDVFGVAQREYNRLLGTLYDRRQAQAAPASTRSSDMSSAVAPNLPQIKLPIFSGDQESWENFRDLFVSLVDKEKLSNVRKLHLLKTSVTGEAQKCIAHLQTTDDNYPLAWQTLLERYDNHRIMLTSHLSRLSTLPSSKREEYQVLRNILDTLNASREALRAIGRPVEYWDDVFVFFATQALDPITKSDWDKQLGASTSPPTYAQFLEFLRGRVHALKNRVSSKTQEDRSTVEIKPQRHASRPRIRSYAVRASGPGPLSPCPSCKGGHYLGRCPQFSNASSAQRRDMSSRLKVCFNCLRPGHSVASCPSERNCQLCKGRHHTLLHTPKRTADQPLERSAKCARTAEKVAHAPQDPSQ